MSSSAGSTRSHDPGQASWRATKRCSTSTASAIRGSRRASETEAPAEGLAGDGPLGPCLEVGGKRARPRVFVGIALARRHVPAPLVALGEGPLLPHVARLVGE